MTLYRSRYYSKIFIKYYCTYNYIALIILPHLALLFKIAIITNKIELIKYKTRCKIVKIIFSLPSN